MFTFMAHANTARTQSHGVKVAAIRAILSFTAVLVLNGNDAQRRFDAKTSVASQQAAALA